MFNKINGFRNIVIAGIFVFVSSWFNLYGQGAKKKTILQKNKNVINIQTGNEKQTDGYLGLYTLFKKRNNIFGSPFALEFSSESSPLYVGLLDYRKESRNFINSYRSFVINLKFPLFKLK